MSISVSRILNDGRNLLITDSEKELDALAGQVTRLYCEQVRLWRGISFHSRVVGVQFYASVVAIVKGQVVRAGQSLIGPVGTPTANSS